MVRRIPPIICLDPVKKVLDAGLAKLEHDPGKPFMKLFVDACMATELKGFNAQALANAINGEGKGLLSTGVMHVAGLRPLPPDRIGQA
jgi:hypothetical protein